MHPGFAHSGHEFVQGKVSMQDEGFAHSDSRTVICALTRGIHAQSVSCSGGRICAHRIRALARLIRTVTRRIRSPPRRALEQSFFRRVLVHFFPPFGLALVRPVLISLLF